jgi:NAD(P)H-flavin reductase
VEKRMKVLVTSVVKNDHISKNICRLSVEFDLEVKPGQFFMLKTTDDAFLLPRPLSVNDVNGNIVSFLYRIEGKGTKTISSLHENDKIQVFGPLGKGFDISCSTSEPCQQIWSLLARLQYILILFSLFVNKKFKYLWI